MAAFALGLTPRAAQAQVATPTDAFERDRQAVLAMAGTFHVRYDTRETVPFLADYEPREPSISGGNEVVRVIEDTRTTIRLQHILVVSMDGRDIVVRHWRHDWHYQPRHVLAYAGADTWRLTPVSSSARRGAWSQIVYNTDDSPRYGALGVWAHDNGVSRWTGARGLRPLARRDAVRNPPYSHYACTNRHAITPTGWVHEQDNAKLGQRDGAPVTFVHEAVINAYDRADDFRISVADDYLSATQPYWNAVRALWDEKIAAYRGLWLQEAAQTGSAAGPPLMEIAERVQAREITLDAAVAQARAIIAGATRQP
jgi:hypothetical protein